MRKILAIVLLLMIATGCGLLNVDYSKPDNVIIAQLPPGNATWEEKWKDEVWVFPAEIQIGDTNPAMVDKHYRAGVKIIYPIVIHADEQATQFHLAYQGIEEVSVTSTYTPSPAQACQWVYMPEPDPYLQAYETRQVPVEFFVPGNITAAPARWVFLVRVDWDQAEGAKQARAVLFQVNMKEIKA